MVERDQSQPTRVRIKVVRDNYVFGAHEEDADVPIHYLQPPKQSGRERKPADPKQK